MLPLRRTNLHVSRRNLGRTASMQKIDDLFVDYLRALNQLRSVWT